MLFAYLCFVMSKKQDSTEEKIKKAALKLFQQKGFSNTTIRDITEEAGTNLALLNYYFGSKENLFNILMEELLLDFEQGLMEVGYEDASLEEKIQKIVDNYTDALLENPDTAIFIMSELRTHEETFLDMLDLTSSSMINLIIQDYQKGVDEGKFQDVNPMHLFMNITSLIIFPFIDKPLLKIAGGFSEAEFIRLLEDRRRLITDWVMKMIRA